MERGLSLSELNKRSARYGSWLLKVAKVDIIEYTYTWQGKEVPVAKLRVIFASRDEGELVSLGEVTGEVTWGEVGPPRGEAGPRFLFWRASTSAIEVPREDWRRCAEPLAGVSAEDDEPAGEGSPSWSLLGSAP